MKKLIVTRNSVVVETQKGTEQEMIAHRDKLIETKRWGKPSRWVSEDRIDIENENIEEALETIVEPIMGRNVTLYRFEEECSFQIVDATAEETSKQTLFKRKMKRQFGENLIDQISTINEAKALDTDDVDAFMSNTLLMSLREHLWAGNITTFVDKLTSSDVSAFFTTQEKNAVIAQCNEFLTSLEA